MRPWDSRTRPAPGPLVAPMRHAERASSTSGRNSRTLAQLSKAGHGWARLWAPVAPSSRVDSRARPYTPLPLAARFAQSEPVRAHGAPPLSTRSQIASHAVMRVLSGLQLMMLFLVTALTRCLALRLPPWLSFANRSQTGAQDGTPAASKDLIDRSSRNEQNALKTIYSYEGWRREICKCRPCQPPPPLRPRPAPSSGMLTHFPSNASSKRCSRRNHAP